MSSGLSLQWKSIQKPGRVESLVGRQRLEFKIKVQDQKKEVSSMVVDHHKNFYQTD